MRWYSFPFFCWFNRILLFEISNSFCALHFLVRLNNGNCSYLQMFTSTIDYLFIAHRFSILFGNEQKCYLIISIEWFSVWNKTTAKNTDFFIIVRCFNEHFVVVHTHRLYFIDKSKNCKNKNDKMRTETFQNVSKDQIKVNLFRRRFGRFCCCFLWPTAKMKSETRECGMKGNILSNGNRLQRER